MRIFRTAEVAEICGLGVPTLYSYLHENYLPFTGRNEKPGTGRMAIFGINEIITIKVFGALAKFGCSLADASVVVKYLFTRLCASSKEREKYANGFLLVLRRVGKEGSDFLFTAPHANPEDEFKWFKNQRGEGDFTAITLDLGRIVSEIEELAEREVVEA